MLITYDGISLPYSENTKFEQEVVYDDFSQTDAVATKFTVHTQFLVNKNFLRMMDPDTWENSQNVDYSAADMVNALGYRLRRPRRSLSLKFNGVEMVPDPEGPGTVDAMNGPKPLYFRFVQLTSETFICEYGIEAVYVDTRRITGNDNVTELTKSSNAGGGVLYNRWEETVTIDECQYSKRTRTGKMTLRSDNPKGLTPDKLRREFCIVSVPDGFVRDSSEFRQSPDGLSIDYTIVDREVFRLPPTGSYKAEGLYRESGKGFNSALRYAECQVRLYGTRLSDQAVLLLTAIRIVSTKLNQAGARLSIGGPKPNAQNNDDDEPLLAKLAFIAPNVVQFFRNKFAPPPPPAPVFKNQAIAQEITAEIDLFNNIVFYRVLARFVGNKRERGGLAVIRGNITQFNSATEQPIYLDRGTGSLLLQAASYWDALLNNNQLTAGTDSGNGDATRTGSAAVRMSVELNRPGEAGKTKET